MKTLLFTVLFSLLSTLAFAEDYHLAWDANTPPIDGYKLHYGLVEGGPYDTTEDVGDVTEYLVTDLPEGHRIYFAATAYYNDEDSDYSNEVVTVAYYFLTIKMDYDGYGKLLYRGEHAVYNASESDTNWTITKYYYTELGSLIEMRRRITSWTDRAVGW